MGTVHKEDEQESTRQNPSRNQSSSSSGSTNPDESINGSNGIFLSPRFKSMAAMAGWDEEAIILASVVDDTPERKGGVSLLSKHDRKKRPGIQSFKTPPTNSSTRRKRKSQKRSPAESIAAVVLNLDDEDEASNRTSGVVENNKKEMEAKEKTDVKSNEDADKLGQQRASAPSSNCTTSSSSLPDMEKLREELSCAICLEMCFEPSTTPCGHSFCKKCLRSAADKCGKRCPKCRQLISNGRSCTVNTVLWNTIQLLFPSEVEARIAAAAAARSSRRTHRSTQSVDRGGGGQSSDQRMPQHRNLAARVRRLRQPTTTGPQPSSSRGLTMSSPREEVVAPNQDDDEDVAPLALRLQREEERQRRLLNNPFARPFRSAASLLSSSSGTGTVIGLGEHSSSRSEVVPNQDQDAALALRLQREEFRRAYGGSSMSSRRGGDHNRRNVSLAAANLRAIASIAINRTRN